MTNKQENTIPYLLGKLFAHIIIFVITIIPLTIFSTFAYINSFDSLSWFQTFVYSFLILIIIDCLYNIIVNIYKINRL